MPLGDLDAYLLADKIFHQTLLEASGNEMFRAPQRVVAEVLTAAPPRHDARPLPNPAAIELHDQSRVQSGCGTRKLPSTPCGDHDEAISAVAEGFRNPPRGGA